MNRVASPVVTVVVFSKDRPLQLDATLRSLDLNCLDVGMARVKVLCKYSLPRFAPGYRDVAFEHPNVSFHREGDFRTDTLMLVSDSEYILFLVDDVLVVGELSIARAVEILGHDPSCLGFSYRLGRNTTYCYPLDTNQRLPTFRATDSGTLTFDWTEAEHDFGYPLELSSSLYRAADLLPLLTDLSYSNPNTLESSLSQHAASFGSRRPLLACYEQSVAVSVPTNLVQTSWPNRALDSKELSADALARLHERGYRVDVQSYRGIVPNACHQELALAYEKDLTIPTVSVVIRCFEQGQYLSGAVGSVATQTFSDWEIVVVDDGSPDDTAAVARRLAIQLGGKLRLIQQANQGLSGAMNAGVLAARGRYILPLDADDRLEPTMLEKTVNLLEHDPSVAIAYTDLQQFGEADQVVQAASFDAARLPEANQLSYCSLYRREVWDAVGGYNPNMRWGYEDWDFWIGAAERGYVARRIPEALLRYRVSSAGMFAGAKRHDAELRRQMRANHPRSFLAQDPVVSIIVPTHNYGHHLPQALESVRSQSFQDWECIVINDGSTDDTRHVLERFAALDARIRFESQPQQGLAATRNRGLRLSRGRYVQFLDSDDLLHPGKLESHVNVLDGAPGVDVVYGPTMYFDDTDADRRLRNGMLVGQTGISYPPAGPVSGLLDMLVDGNIMTVAAPLVRSSVFDSVGLFDTTLQRLEDWDFWLRCALGGNHFQFAPADEAVALIRVHETSMSAEPTAMVLTELKVRQRMRAVLPRRLRHRNETLLAQAATTAALQVAFAGHRRTGLRILVPVAVTGGRLWPILGVATLFLMMLPGGRGLANLLRVSRRRLRKSRSPA